MHDNTGSNQYSLDKAIIDCISKAIEIQKEVSQKREMALVITKLEEATLWYSRVFHENNNT